MRDGRMAGATKGGTGLLCAVTLCIGVAAVVWADGIVPQTEVYDGLANTAFSSAYMDRADYQGSVNSVGMCDAATLSVGAGAVAERTSSSDALFTLFGRYAQSSAARPLNTRPFVGFTLSIK